MLETNRLAKLEIRNKILKKIMFEMLLYYFFLASSLFLVLFVLTNSIKVSRETTVREELIELTGEMNTLNKLSDKLGEEFYTEPITMEDLELMLAYPMTDYFKFKTNLYLETNSSVYNGIQNLVKNSFKSNEALEGVYFYSEEKKVSVLFANPLGKYYLREEGVDGDDTLSIDKILSDKLNEHSNQEQVNVMVKKTIFNPVNLMYVADVYFIYNITDYYEKAEERIERNLGYLSIKEHNHFYRGKTNIEKYLILEQREMNQYSFYATKKYNSIFHEFSTVYIIYLSIVIVVFFIMIFFSIRRMREMEMKLDVLVKKMNAIKSGNWDLTLFDTNEVNQQDELSLISNDLNDVATTLSEYVSEVYESEIKLRDYQLKNIRSQVNPHFLFNTIESIRMKALVNEDQIVADMLYNMSQLYRNLIRGPQQVTLKEEMAMCGAYLSLYESRYEDYFFWDISYHDDLKELLVEKFSIQPLIENFIHHGLKEDEINFIQIHANFSDEQLAVTIENNGKKIPEEKLREINQRLLLSNIENQNKELTGLYGVDFRLKKLFGQDYGVKIENSEEGIIVYVSMPVLYSKE